MLGCLLGGVIISYYVSKINNRPLLSIVNKVIGTRSESVQLSSKVIDEYSLIDDKIDAILHESARSNLRLEEQQTKIESLFLTSVLGSELRDDQSIFASMQRLDLEFLCPQYVIMLIRANEKEIVSDFKFKAFINQLRQTYKDYHFIAAEYRGDMILLYNVENEVTSKMLEALANDFQPLLSYLSGSITVLGGIYDSLSDIIVSYRQARKIADNKQESQIGVFVYDPAFFNSSSGPNDSFQVMAEFNRLMEGQNYEEAQKLIDPLFSQYIAPEEDSYLFQCKKYAVINRIVEGVNTVALHNKSIDVNACIELLSNSKTVTNLSESAHEIMATIIEKNNQSAVRQSDGVAKRAWDIVENGYTDPLMGLYSISEQLSVTNSYLSKVFKETFGIGLIQHINHLRVEKAKTLIFTSTLSVKEIAERVGFSSDVSFIRVFKQYTNTTPRKFKGASEK